MTEFDPNTPVSPALAKIRKLVVSLVTTGAALGTWLATEDHTAAELVAAAVGFVVANYGVWKATNAPE